MTTTSDLMSSAKIRDNCPGMVQLIQRPGDEHVAISTTVWETLGKAFVLYRNKPRFVAYNTRAGQWQEMIDGGF